MRLKVKSIAGMAFVSLMMALMLAFSTANAAAQTKKHKVNPKLAAEAKITFEEARNIALKARSGKVEDEELEKEKGVLMYSFDIRADDGKLFEVEIDAKSGAVLNNKEDSEDEKGMLSKAASGTIGGMKTAARAVKRKVGKIFS